jgi:hypothetical protein
MLEGLKGFLYLPGVIAILVGQTRVTCHGDAPFVSHTLGSIIGDSGWIVSSILPSTSALYFVHIPTGKMGTRPLPGVQIFGFTNSNRPLIWQVFSVSSQSATALVFSTTATFVDQTVPPSDNFMYQACVEKRSGPAQDFDLTLNSYPVE